MLFVKLIFLNVEIFFIILINFIFIVILVFFCFFIIIVYRKYRVVKKSKFIDMINVKKEKENFLKLRYFKGILGVLLIIFGYIIVIMIKEWDLDLIIVVMIVLLCVLIGIYFFFGSFMFIVFNKIIKNKKLVYKNVMLVSIFNMYFRLKGNYCNLVMIVILCVVFIIVLGVSLLFEEVVKREVIKEFLYSFSYEGNGEKLKEKIEDIVKDSNYELSGINENKFLLGKVNYKNYFRKID